MNERIRELMAQAVTFYLDPDSNSYEAQVSPENMERFAELIVRECMNAIYNIDDLGGYHFKAATAVKEHFGVSE